MSDSKALIRRIFDDVINNGNTAAVDELFTDDYVDHGPMGDMHGRDRFRQLVEQWRAAVPDVHCTVENLAVEGDIAGRALGRARHVPDTGSDRRHSDAGARLATGHRP